LQSLDPARREDGSAGSRPDGALLFLEASQMPATQFVINVHGGIVQDVYCSDPAAEVLVVDWDVDGSQPGEPGIVEVQLPRYTLNAAVGTLSVSPLQSLAGTDVQAALDAAQAQGLLTRPDD
jgi:hypothetical protein